MSATFTSISNKALHWLTLGALSCIAMTLNGCDVSNNSATQKPEDSDSVVVELAIAYVERSIPVDEDGNLIARDILDPSAFLPGARLIIKDRASPNAPERVITDRIFPDIIPEDGGDPIRQLYDVKDLEVSADGKKLLFAMRAPEIEDADEEDQPTWNIWEYDVEDDSLRRVIEENIFAELGEDISPQYLVDGRIIFSSDRQDKNRAVMLDEIKPRYSALDDDRRVLNFNIHVMDKDGSDIEQISFNVSQDLYPTLRSNGDLLYLRRDGIANKNAMSLYTSKIDGSDVQPHYGYHSQSSGTNDTRAVLVDPKEMPDGRILAILQPTSTLQMGGDMVAVDTEGFTDIQQTTRDNDGATGPAMVSLSSGDVNTAGDSVSLGGYYNSASPLRDGTNRLLISWSQCRLINPDTDENAPCTQSLIAQGAELAPPLFGLWIYDTDTGVQLPVNIPDEGIMYTDGVIIAPRTEEESWSPETRSAEYIAERVGILNIRNIYDIDGVDASPFGIAAMADPTQTSTDERTVRFLRIVKSVYIPDETTLDFDNAIFGRSAAQGMRDILGYVPVEPDGSAMFKVPANMPFMIDLVDARGRRVGRRHENWLSLTPGEERECTGCHTANSELPHGRRDAEAESAYAGAAGGIAFNNTRLMDDFGFEEVPPEFSETMAEYYARVKEPRTPSMDILFADEWTDPAAATPGADIALRYLDIFTPANANPLDPNCAARDPAPPAWSAPTTCQQTGSWSTICRTTINYQEHIHPLWTADRRTCDSAGTLVANDTCSSCHSRGGAEILGYLPGQLELTGEVSADRNDYITSYAELMFQDNEQELVDNSLTDVVLEVPTGEFETDADGNLILDENGDPIPIINLINIPVNPAMSTDGANSSNRFFRLFEPGASHYGRLSDSELKLIAEWLDIGGQYYNNPFDAPAN